MRRRVLLLIPLLVIGTGLVLLILGADAGGPIALAGLVAAVLLGLLFREGPNGTGGPIVDGGDGGAAGGHGGGVA